MAAKNEAMLRLARRLNLIGGGLLFASSLVLASLAASPALLASVAKASAASDTHGFVAMLSGGSSWSFMALFAIGFAAAVGATGLSRAVITRRVPGVLHALTVLLGAGRRSQR